MKEKIEGFEEVNETATAMVCIRFVSLKVVVHFWPFLNEISNSLTSGFTSLSMALAFAVQGDGN